MVNANIGDLDGIVASQLKRLVELPRNDRVDLGAFRRVVRQDVVAQLVAFQSVKADLGRHAGPRQLLRQGVEPCVESRLASGRAERLLCVLNGGCRHIEFLTLCIVDIGHCRRWNSISEKGHHAGLRDVGEESAHAIVIARRNRVIFVVVAACAFHRQSEEGRARGLCAVGHVFDSEFL